MRKIYFLLFVLSFIQGFTQTVDLFNPSNNEAYPAQQYFCTSETFNLKVDAVATSTGDYSIQQITGFNVPATTVTVPFSNTTGNDHFSRPITIPFNFDFYGKQYTRLVVGSNGRLLLGSGADFDNLHTNRYVDKMHSGNDASSSNIKLPNVAYNQIDSDDFSRILNFAQIFFGFTDLNYYNSSDYNELTYGPITYNGIKGLLINFKQVLERTVSGGYSSTITSQVLILEDNRFLIKVIKLNATGNAIIGIQNEAGYLARWPANSETASPFNNGQWSSSGTQTWEFIPNQNLTPKFKWFQNTVQLSETGNTLSGFTPNDSDVLKVEVTYHDTSGAQVGAAVSDQIKFSTLPTPTVSVKSATCSQSVLETPLLNDMTYEWLQVGSSSVISTTNQVAVSVTGSYFVRMRHRSSANCFTDSAPLAVNFASSFPSFNNSPKYLCKTDASTSITVNLYDYYPANPSQYSLVFQENGVNIPNYTSFPISANTTRKITIIAQNTSGTCTFTDTLDIVFASLPVNGKVYSPDKTCGELTSYKISDFRIKFFSTQNYEISFSTDGMNYNLTEVNPSVNNPVYVKIKHPDFDCESTGTVNFTTHPQVTANTPDPNNPDLVQCASATQSYNLHALFDNEINPGNVTVTYHTTAAGAQSGDNSVPNASAYRSGIGETVLHIRVVDNATGCVAPNFPTVKLLVYLKPRIISANPIILKNCVGNNQFNLTQNISDLTSAQPPIVPAMEYYSQNGTLLTSSQITNYDSSVHGSKPYIKIIYNSTCDDIVNFDLQFNLKPAASISQIVICEELAYSLKRFQNAVISNSSQFTFTDEVGKALPNSFDVSVLPKTIKFLMKDKTTGCVSDVQTVTFVKGANTALQTPETDFILCDADFDGQTLFDLKTKNTVFSNDANAVFEYFKDENFTQPIAANYTNQPPFAQTVYVKITVPGFCPSIGKINLKVNISTKASTLLDQYFICFGETLIIDAGSENPTRAWSTGETSQTISITKAGNYSVVLTNNNGCSYTHNFTVSDENQPKIEVINQAANSIEVVANGGAKPYRYYFNGVAQSSSILMNPSASSYQIQVESASGCLGEPRTAYFIKINNAFTPNADGINDVWKVENLEKMENVSIIIVDRYGNKVFESQNSGKVEWDGKNGGRELPTSTYWYTVTWFDAVTQKSEQQQGWILMKNRN